MKRLLSLLIFCISLSTLHAQFVQGWGIMAGGTLGRQNWYYHNPDSKYKLNYLLRYNAEVFAEMGQDPTFRWVTELQYNVKSSKLVSEGENLKLINQYAAWNNYLMVRKEMLSIIPYVKVGPRLEYVFNSSQSFSRFHITGALGAGVEFVAYGPVALITEAWWVPDVTKSYTSDVLDVKQHAWELRVGLKFAISGGGDRGPACPKVYK